MENSFFSRLKNAWNVFRSGDDLRLSYDMISSTYYRPDRPRLSRGNERTIIASVINKIAMDVAAIKVNHVRIDENDRFLEVIKSDLNNCLTLEANIDQTGRSFIQDIAMSMMDEGVVAIVPTDTSVNPNDTGSFDILTMRTGQIVQWMPRHIQANVYNERSGQQQQIILSKSTTGIVENPLYAVMNEPNSTMQRLIRKLNLMDIIDEQNSSGKLDLIIQLPYVIKNDMKKEQAEARRKEIERQLASSKYGIAYTDGTEKITQLNRAVENNLLAQVEFYTRMLYSQLGITEGVMDGTADEETMLNYYSRTVEPIIAAIVDEMKRKFLTKTARTQGQSIQFFRDPFKLVPTSKIPDIADKLTRNEILAPNEIRQIIGYKPSKDPKADELRNRNINQSNDKTGGEQVIEETAINEGENQNG